MLTHLLEMDIFKLQLLILLKFQNLWDVLLIKKKKILEQVTRIFLRKKSHLLQWGFLKDKLRNIKNFKSLF